MIPYDAEMIAKILRIMPQDRLDAVSPRDFQRHPLPAITKGAVIGEMIAHEKQRRMKNG